MRRNFLLLSLMLMLAGGCAPIPQAGHFARPAGMFPAEGLVVQRALLTVYGRQFALNGYLVLSPTGGKRLIVTETFGNVMADVLEKPDGTVFVMRSSRMFPEQYIRRLMAADVECIFGGTPMLDCPVTMPETNHFVVDRGGYKLDLRIVETKPARSRLRCSMKLPKALKQMTMRDSISAARISGPAAQADGASLFEFNFNAGDPVFAGHFPQRPILPGVFQLEIVRMAAEWLQNRQFAVQEIAKAKFQRPVLPGETLTLSLKLSLAAEIVSARANFSCGGQAAGEAFLKL